MYEHHGPDEHSPIEHAFDRGPAGWVAYGRPGAGRPKIGTEVRATIPAGQVARLDAIAAARNEKRTDVIRRAIAGFLQQHQPGAGTGREPEDDDAGHSL